MLLNCKIFLMFLTEIDLLLLLLLNVVTLPW